MGKIFFLILCICCNLLINANNNGKSQVAINSYWKVGVASVNITPHFPIWMAGYTSRTSESNGKLHDLHAKSLALEDVNGKRVVFVTIDILGIPKDVSERVRYELKCKYGLDKSCIILNCSHTHSGPVLSDALKYIYPMDENQRLVVKKYTTWFEKKIIEVVDYSLRNMQQGKIYTGNGTTRFQVNRRENNEMQLTNTTELMGSVDYSVPVIKVENKDKKTIAVVFGYACHPTVLNINKISGDYPGFAQIELEKLFPDALSMFFQGTGGDLNPLPRRSLALAKQYGKELAAAVECVLSDSMTEQYPHISVAYKEINLQFGHPPTLDQLKVISKEDDFNGRWAQGLIAALNSKKEFTSTYPYPIQIWRIGGQYIFSLSGEVLSSYGSKLKKNYGQDIFVMAYSNDVMGYIPSAEVIKEDEGKAAGYGYEGFVSQRVYGLPAVWDTRIEVDILNNIDQLFREINQ